MKQQNLYLLLLLGIILHLQLLQSSAAEPSNGNTIEVRECNINLIDKVTLAVDRPGIIGKVAVKEGDRVQENSLVAQLKNEEAAAQVQLANKAKGMDVESRLAAKNHDLAVSELDRANKVNLSPTKPITEYEINRLQLAVDQTKLEIEKADDERELKSLEYDVAIAKLKAHDINSTFSGTVVKLYKSAGEAVQQGDPVCEIVNDERLRIEGYVPVDVLHLLKTGQPVSVSMKISPESPEITSKGIINFIDVVVQPITREVRIFAEVENPDHKLKPGLRATMQIHLDNPQKISSK